MSTSYFSKDPDAVLDYGIDWSAWLAADEDTITASEWTVPDGLTKESDTFDDTSTTVWFSGGDLGEKYTVVNRITTDQGRIEDKTLTFTIRQH